MDRSLQNTLILVILVVGASISYYYAIFLPQKKNGQTQMEAIRADIETRQAEQQQSNLDYCLATAEQRWLQMGQSIVAFGKDKEAQGQCGAGCEEALIIGHQENDKRLQQDKENCFAQYR